MKTFDFPLANNPLRSRDDLARSLLQLAEPVEARWVADGRGFHLGNAAAHYSPRVALMEGFSRLLWGIGPLVAGGGDYPWFERTLETLRRGVDADSADGWQIAPDRDQRLVEMAAISLCLMIAPDRFWLPLDDADKERLRAWLAVIQHRQMPANNWHFFRVLTQAAFRRLGLPVDETAEKESLDLIESLYRGDGWYEDGANSNYDFYNPFAFHFYGLAYARLMGDLYPERAARYVERARLFAPQFLPWFREDGSVVPYGRSLTYRFAAVSFFSACAFADVEVLPWGQLKGIVLRHLRWWFSQPILDPAGLLSVGWAYPDLLMAEQYNAPGSPYWALKTYLVLALGDDHPFWTAEEAPLPALPEVSSLAVPRYLVQRSAEDVQLLCPGRYPGWEAVQAAAKYCKFAYSARFGFSISHGAWGLEKTGCDSSLVLSEGDGYWRERRAATGQECGPNWTRGRWKPWADVEIDTTLVALGAWHVRIHRIRSARPLEAVEGGFSVPLYRGHEPAPAPDIRLSEGLIEQDGKDVEKITKAYLSNNGDKVNDGSKVATVKKINDVDIVNNENKVNDVYFVNSGSKVNDVDFVTPDYPLPPSSKNFTSALLSMPWAASRIVDLLPGSSRRGEVITMEPNLNVMHPSGAVPVLRGRIPVGESFWACAVRAGDTVPVAEEEPPRLEDAGDGRVRIFQADGKEIAVV